MLKKLKGYLTAITAAAITISCVGCTVGDSTANAMTIDGYTLKAGIYIFYQDKAMDEAKNLAKEANSEIDITDEDALEETTIEGKKFLDWVSERTLASCSEHVAISKKFDEMKLKLSDTDQDDIKAAAAANYENYPEYSENGIGEQSLAEILSTTYKTTELFDAIYGEGGTENVQESEIKDYYVKNNSRVKYVDLDLHDAEGNVLDDAGKKEIKAMAEKYLSKVKSQSSEEDMLKAFNEVQEEYDKYVADKAAEASSEEAQTTTTAVTTVTATNSTAATTTTTTNPYANESIIPVVTTNEDTKEEDLTYSPSKAFYDWVYNTSTKTGVPEIIEDSENETIYVAVKLDINKRMTSDDLWSEDAINNQRYSKYSKAFQDKIDEWTKVLKVKLNQSAIDRYKPFDYEEPTSSSAGGY